MQFVKDYRSSRHTIILMGPPKSGKSTLAVNLFGRENTIVIAYDREGMKSVGKVDQLLIDPSKVAQETIDALAYIKSHCAHKKCIIVNDMTHAGRYYYAVAPASKDDRKMYQYAIQNLRSLVMKLNSEFPNQHIIYECVDMYIEDKEDKVVYNYPNVPGRTTFAQEFPGMVDHVFYVNLPREKTTIINGKPIKSIERTILTASDGLRLAGNRLNIAGESKVIDLSESVMIEDGSFANIEALRKKILGE